MFDWLKKNKQGKPSYEELQQEVLELRDRVNHMESEKEDLKSNFLSNISHELRTPMNAIIGFSNLLADNDITVEEKREYVKHINNSSDQLLSLVDKVIDASMLETRQMKLYPSDCFINKVLFELYVEFEKEKIRQSKDHVEVLLYRDSEDLDLTMYLDELRFKQVLKYLINNALQYSGEGEIEFGYQLKDNKNIIFFIKDTGKSFPINQQQFVFDHFKQFNDSESKRLNGTGLGLSISKGLVNLMGGRMWLEPNSRQGSIINFSLPVLHKSQQQKQAAKINDTFS